MAPPTSTHQDLTDEQLAALLNEDAKHTSARLTALTFGSQLTKNRSAPHRPNTRFLENIIRSTDSHNSALSVREAEDSKARLTQLRTENKKTPKPGREIYSARDRQSGQQRQYGEVEKDPDGRAKNHMSTSDDARRRPRDIREGRSGSRTRRSDGHSSSRKQLRDRSRSPLLTTERVRSPRASSRPRSHRQTLHQSSRRSSRSRSRSRSPRRRHRHARTISSSPPRRVSQRKGSIVPLDNDEEENEDDYGPRPAPRGRGRSSKQDMDARFASSYDPSTDVGLDDSFTQSRSGRSLAGPDTGADQDWDMALEALRDRAMLAKNGAERLRAAGFREDEVQRYRRTENSEATGDDRVGVVWKGKGQAREWDLSKELP